jgi:hypothetical protein
MQVPRREGGFRHVGIVTRSLYALAVVLPHLDSRAQSDDLDRRDLRRTLDVLTVSAV